MTFQIEALPADDFAPLFELSDEALSGRSMRRMTATASPGFPCRVSLEDAAIGEELILLPYEHLPHATPYRASHAIFVRKGAAQARPRPGEVPPVLLRRPISLRAFDAHHMMIAADLAEGEGVSGALGRLIDQHRPAYVHLHNAKPGCYAAKAIPL